MKIQPIDNQTYGESATVKPVLKSRLKRLFDRQFHGVLKTNSEKVNVNVTGEVKDGEIEPSSVCLAKMVQNFIEDEKPKCGRNRCNCFNGNINDISDDEFDLSAAGDSIETLKSLTPCSSVLQRNLLTDTSNIIEKNKSCKRKDELRRIVTEGLVSTGYDASICKSHWEKSASYPAGEYEYLDVIIEGGDRVLIDVDFRSEFEIARPTGNYKAILHSLPYIFVGDADRLKQIVLIVTEAARLSLKKKGMPVPPWRKFEYMKSKWLTANIRTPPSPSPSLPPPPTPPPTPDADTASSQVFSKKSTVEVKERLSGFSPELTSEGGVVEVILPVRKSDEGSELSAGGRWVPPAIERRNKGERGRKVTGLASLFTEGFKG